MRLFEDPVARLLVRRLAGDQLVEGRLGVEHHRPQLALRSRPPARSNSFGSTRLASLPSSFRPSESASRFAGSIVSTQTLSPRAAIPVAIAAEVVVLPTPPEPAQMQMSLPSRISLDRRHQPSLFASRRAASTPSSGSKRKGRVLTGASTRRRRRASWARWERARLCSETAARAAARSGAVLAAGELGELLGLLVGEALRVEAVHVDAVDGDADLVAQVVLERRRLVDRHLLGQGDDRGAGVLLVGDQAVELLGLGVDRADPGDRGEGARRLQEADAVAGGGGVDDHQVVLAPRLDLAVELGQLPDLADRDQLLQARAWPRRGS